VSAAGETLAALTPFLGEPPAARLLGADPAVPSSFRIGRFAASAIAASAGMAAALYQLRGGAPQTVSVGIADAVTEFRSERYLTVDGAKTPDPWDAIAGAYRSGDGGYVRIHTNFPHHRDGILRLLGCGYDRASVEAALQGWTAAAFEDAAAAAGMVAARMRRFAEWDATPQAAAIASEPLVSVARAGVAARRELGEAARPLSGIRVVEMTRVIAGPVCGRVLASHGAEVLRLIGPDLPTIAALDIDTGHGKRSAYCDLREAEARALLDTLLAGADVFLHSYRPGALERFGLGEDAVPARHPGLIYASLSAYGTKGAWAGRRGFDSLVQTAAGFNHAEGEAFGAEGPRALPAQVLDHGTGHLLAAGIISALGQRAVAGGSWRVHASLARTGLWLRRFGQDADGAVAADLADAAASSRIETVASLYGRLSRVRPAANLPLTPLTLGAGPRPYGEDAAEWLDN
jgi:crotonobetainyl-CoA:carnitine CoA-transferase CaiB-like acyl-CoA transferase